MDNNQEPTLLTSLRQRIESTTELPVMPEIARALLRLNSDPDGNINELVEIIETDPSMAAQVMRYARSAFFGYRGDIHSLHQAVTAVIGYSLTINIALGLALGKSFSIPNSGPMALYPIWQHSLYSAALIERLIHIMPRQHRPIPGLGFLGGLVHNFGVLLIAQLFKKEAVMLRQIIVANPDKSAVELERQILGTDHMEIGAWLMRSWNLQAEIQVAVAEHHDEFYDGVHASYAKLALLADRLLKRHDIGDADTTDIPPALLTSLGITETEAEEQLDNIINSAQDLNILAQQFAA